MTPLVIAEMASTHDGVLDMALELVQIAKAAGAEAVKTAWGSSAERIAERMHTAEHVESYRALICWPAAWLPILSQRAHDLGLEFLCTVDCPEDIAVVAPHVDRFKIASWGAMDAAFIRAHLEVDRKKPMVISTGVTEGRALAAIRAVAGNDRAYDFAKGPVHLLHCVSAYPAPAEDLNLGAIRHEHLDGFSDHTKDVMTGAVAVAAGARVLEVHYHHPETAKDNPDRPVSLDPGELADYILLARRAAVMLGYGPKRIMPSEETNVRHRYV